MKELKINQFNNHHEYKQALKRLKKETSHKRDVRKKNGNLHILELSGEPKEVHGVLMNNAEYDYAI